jgi:hypothetical protein
MSSGSEPEAEEMNSRYGTQLWSNTEDRHIVVNVTHRPSQLQQRPEQRLFSSCIPWQDSGRARSLC